MDHDAAWMEISRTCQWLEVQGLQGRYTYPCVSHLSHARTPMIEAVAS
jgi:hypothetical protein